MEWLPLLETGLGLTLKAADVLGRWLAPGEEDLEKLRDDTRQILAEMKSHGQQVETAIKERHDAVQAAIDAAKPG